MDGKRTRRYFAMGLGWVASLMLVSAMASYATVQITGAQVKNESLKGLDIKNATLLAADLGANSVGVSELKNANVTNAKLGDNSVTSGKISDGTIGLGDLSGGIQSLLTGSSGHSVAASGTVSQTGVGTVSISAAYNNLGSSPTATQPNATDYALTIPGFDPLTNVLTLTPIATSDQYRFAVSFDNGTDTFTIRFAGTASTNLAVGDGYYFVVA